VAIVRGPLSSDGWTPVPNHWTRNPTLSWKAKGLLAYVAGHAAGYELLVAQIVEDGAEGKDAVQSGLEELERAGYLRRTRRRNGDGTWGSYDYELTELPASEPGRDQSGSDQGGKTRTGSDQAEHDVSAGQNQSGSAAPDNPPAKKTTSKKTREDNSKAPPSRGTRLPSDFEPTEEMRAWFREQHYGGSPARWLEEHRRFVDYWIAKPGAAGVKLDWPATWRNWMRKAAERIGPTTAAQRAPAYKTAAEKGEERRSEEAEVARIADELAAQYGTDPKDPIANLKIGREARQIYESQSTTCQPTGYSGPNNQDVLDAEWTEHPTDTPREVTAA
jgi:hypothetical protein